MNVDAIEEAIDHLDVPARMAYLINLARTDEDVEAIVEVLVVLFCGLHLSFGTPVSRCCFQ